MDECRNDPCGSGAQCTNIPGGYRCSCAQGFERNPAYPASLLGAHPSSASLASATLEPAVYPASEPSGPQERLLGSSAGSSGSSGSNGSLALVACLDINECAPLDNAKPPVCGHNAQCINTPGGFFCQCPPNFTGNPKLACTDIDECQAHACGPNAQCKNTPGSFQCECKPGFTGEFETSEL